VASTYELLVQFPRIPFVGISPTRKFVETFLQKNTNTGTKEEPLSQRQGPVKKLELSSKKQPKC
jgi:hypothetical protein